jgi:two-component system OmpR family response regulator
LLYDYALQVGDTFKRYWGDSLAFEHIVDSVGYVDIGGVPHKWLSLSPVVDNPFLFFSSYTFIEGLGCAKGVLYPYYPSFFEEDRLLFCFEKNGSNPSVNPAISKTYFLTNNTSPFGPPYFIDEFDFNNTSSCGFLSVDEVQDDLAGHFSIYPNPASGRVWVEGINPPADYAIQSIDGKLLQRVARALKEDVYRGFEIGADDYIPKPFTMRELLLRIRSVLRRTIPHISVSKASIYNLGTLHFDFAQREVSNGTQSIKKLSTKESELLRIFCESKNMLVSRSRIMIEVWGSDDYFVSRSLDVYITRLRKIVSSDPNISIQNFHSIGYKLTERASV